MKSLRTRRSIENNNKDGTLRQVKAFKLSNQTMHEIV
jgi:hypothetical protein